MSLIGSVLSIENLPGMKENSNNMASFNHTPIISTDCERAFSVFKDFLTNKRYKETDVHLRDQMMIE
uniref:Putative LOC100573760 [Acyrthosiphon pisum] n=1 Tax=Lepeophtheirus salmonis TaxID=72036 RepID=A0A0K2SYE7_LEPSM